MRGIGGTSNGPASYTNELLCEIFQYDLATNTISRIQERFALQTLFKADVFYMQMLAAQKWPSKDIPMRMSSGSILQVKNYDEHHFVYFDKVDDWYKPTQFPFVIDWKINDNGKFVTFSRQEIEQERAVGVQRLTNPAHRSIMSINMFDSATLTLSYYIGNSCIPFTSTNGKRLDKLIEQRHLPNDASFIAVPGYHRVNFPFVVMDVSSKGEIYIVNTKTWFR